MLIHGFKKNLFIGILILICSCSSNNAIKIGSGNGSLALAIKNNTKFDPHIDHSRIDYFIVSIEGEGIENSIKQKYGFDTENVTFEGFETGKTINVTIEAVNFNGYVILRGKTENVLLRSGNTTVTVVDVKPVPVFANVYHNSKVYKQRFIPKVFAPDDVNFEVIATEDGKDVLLEDVISGSVDFSITAADVNQIKSIYIKPLNEGTKQLTVRDINSGEQTSINLNVVDNGQVKALPTTAGAYIGSLMSRDPYFQKSTMQNYFTILGE